MAVLIRQENWLRKVLLPEALFISEEAIGSPGSDDTTAHEDHLHHCRYAISSPDDLL